MKKLILLICVTFLSQFLFAQWEVITNGQYPDIQEIDFPTNEIGYACGTNFILKTTDGGDNWNKIETDYDFKTIDFPSEMIGFAAGKDSTICKTIDGGLTWTQLHTPHLINTFLDFNSIVFKDENIGFIAAGGFETNEGFSIWNSYGYILKTTDGGKSWEYKNTWTGMESIFIIEGTNTIYAAGGIQSPWGPENTLLKSVDMGNDWTQIEGEIETPFMSVNCFDEQNIIVNGYYSIFQSNDSAATFSSFNLDTLHPEQIYDSYLINKDDYYFVGRNSSIFKFSFKNQTFQKILIDNLDNDLYDIVLVDNKVGFIVGSNGVILRNKTITSIRKQKENNINVSIFPNPAMNVVNLYFQEFSEYEIRIYNHEKLINSITLIGNKTDLNITNFPSGVYFIEIKSKAGKWTKKIVKI